MLLALRSLVETSSTVAGDIAHAAPGVSFAQAGAHGVTANASHTSAGVAFVASEAQVMALGYAGVPSGSGFPPPMVGGWVLYAAPGTSMSCAANVDPPTCAAVATHVAPGVEMRATGEFVPVPLRKLLERAQRVAAYEAARVARLDRLAVNG